MQLFLTDQTVRMPEHLRRMKALPLMAYRPEALQEATNVIELGKGPDVFQRAVAACGAYRIFPVQVMRALPEWVQDHRSVQVGDTIVQQVQFPPVRSFSQKVLFGVRILEVIDEVHRQGFSYGTLVGHVEKGVSTFTVERADDMVVFKVRTVSGPGIRLTALFPFLSKPYQAYCTRRALAHMKARIG